MTDKPPAFWPTKKELRDALRLAVLMLEGDEPGIAAERTPEYKALLSVSKGEVSAEAKKVITDRLAWWDE